MTAAPAVTPESIDMRYTLVHLLRKDSKPYELLKKIANDGTRTGLVEYTLIVLFVVLVFWVAVKSTTLDEALGSTWGKIQDCVGSPFTGSSSRSFKHSKLAGSVFTFTDQQIAGQNSMKYSDSAT